MTKLFFYPVLDALNDGKVIRRKAPMRCNRIVTTAVWLCLTGWIPAFGQFNAVVVPTSAYTGATTLIPITPADNTVTSSLTDGTQTIAFSSPVTVATVPGTWNIGGSWGSPPAVESSTPRVLHTSAMNSPTSLTMTLSVPSHTFGFEIDQAINSALCTVQFYNGSTLLGTVSQTITPGANAVLMAASDSTTITSVVITEQGGGMWFGMAQFRYGSTLLNPTSATPLPGTFFMGGLGMMLLAAGVLFARRRNAAAWPCPRI